MKSRIIITVLIFSSIITNAQKGYLGKTFSIDMSTDVSNRRVVFNSLKINYVLDKKTEIFGQFGTSLNSKVLTNINFDDTDLYWGATEYANMNFELGRSLISNRARYTTNIRINTIHYGAGVRFYRKTKLAPIGKYFEIGYSKIRGSSTQSSLTYDEIYHGGEHVWVHDSITNSDQHVFVPDLVTTNHDVPIEILNINQINFGFHRKIVFKDAWYITTGFNIPIRWPDNILDYLSNDNDHYYRNSLSINNFYICFSAGKILF